MKHTQIIFIVLMFFLILPGALAVTVMPVRFDIEYEPGKDESFMVIVSGVKKPFIVFEGDLSELAQVTRIESNGETHQITFGFKTPENYPSGDHTLLALFQEDPENLRHEGGAIYAVPRMGVPVKFYIPYPDKFLRLDDFRPQAHVASGQDLTFTAKVKSLGKKSINTIQGKAYFHLNNERFEALFTPVYDVELDEEVSVTGKWGVPADARPGHYVINGSLDYDGQTLILPSREFNVGGKMLEVVSITPTTIASGSIVPIDVTVRNTWNDPLSYSVSLTLYTLQNQKVAQGTSQTRELAAYGI